MSTNHKSQKKTRKQKLDELEKQAKQKQAELQKIIEETKKKADEIKAKMIELKKQKAQLIEEEAKLTKESLEKKVAKFFDDNKYPIALPISWKDATETGTEVQMWSKYVDLPEKWHHVKIVHLPVAHYCESCEEVTKHLFLYCDFPFDYYPNDYGPNGNVPITEDCLHCIECMFHDVGINHVKNLDVMKHMKS